MSVKTINRDQLRKYAKHCTTHHHACDCRELEQAERIAELERERDFAREELSTVMRQDNARFNELEQTALRFERERDEARTQLEAVTKERDAMREACGRILRVALGSGPEDTIALARFNVAMAIQNAGKLPK